MLEPRTRIIVGAPPFLADERVLDADVRITAHRFTLSARAYGRILRVARTIVDLAGAKDLTVHHVSEALIFRQLDGEGLDTRASPIRYSSGPEARPGLGVH
jgi:hypothetical protein